MKGRLTLIAVTLFAIFAMAFTPSIAFATGSGTWSVDIGNPASETQSGIVIAGWGPVEPLAHGGTWGGITGDCRVTWESSGSTAASVTYSYDSCVFPSYLEWKSLDGAANDSYEVYVDGVLVFTYTNGGDTETWSVAGLSLSQFTFKNDVVHTVEFVATGEAWALQGTYGQLAIDYVTLVTLPCVGNGNVGLEVVVGNPDCICIDVSPATLNFGLLYPGQSVTKTDAITIDNCGNVQVKVTASTTNSFYAANLKLNATILGSWEDTIAASASDKVDATLSIPAAETTGTASGQLVFWAVKN